MIQELRTYTCVAGKLPVVLQRFETVTLELFKFHGMRCGPLFTVLAGSSNHQIRYALDWDSLAQRETAWAAFKQDPRWLEAASQSERDGPIVANIAVEFLQAVPFSLA